MRRKRGDERIRRNKESEEEKRAGTEILHYMWQRNETGRKICEGEKRRNIFKERKIKKEGWRL